MYLYYLQLTKEWGGSSTIVTSTSQPITLTMAVPNTYPMYADYAVAILNEDGSVTIKKDIDIDAATISFSTTAFRMMAVMYGPIGTFDSYK